MFTQPANAANKASSNNFNRQSSLYSLAGGPAKKTLKLGLPLALAFSFLLGLMAVPQSAHGQTFSVLYSFTNEVDGVSPDSLVLDAAGKLYGTAFLVCAEAGVARYLRSMRAARKRSCTGSGTEPTGKLLSVA